MKKCAAGERMSMAWKKMDMFINSPAWVCPASLGAERSSLLSSFKYFSKDVC